MFLKFVDHVVFEENAEPEDAVQGISPILATTKIRRPQLHPASKIATVLMAAQFSALSN
jgi:hypothetical protein